MPLFMLLSPFSLLPLMYSASPLFPFISLLIIHLLSSHSSVSLLSLLSFRVSSSDAGNESETSGEHYSGEEYGTFFAPPKKQKINNEVIKEKQLAMTLLFLHLFYLLFLLFSISPVISLISHIISPLLSESEHDGLDHGDDYEEVDNYTNHDMVEKAFQECDLNHEGRYC